MGFRVPRSLRLFGSGRKQGDHVSLADAARDRRDWSTAARAYRAALDENPGRADVWVQYGHALKESGNRAGGLEAYRVALRLEPQNSDTALQIGHVLKIMGQRDEAARWYALSVLWPDPHPEGQRELDSLALPPEKLRALLGTLGSQPSKPRSARWVPVHARSGCAQDETPDTGWLERIGERLSASKSKEALAWCKAGEAERSLVVVAVSDLRSLDAAAEELDRAWACGDVAVLALLCDAEVLQAATFEAGLVAKIDAVLRRCEGVVVPFLSDAGLLDGRARLLDLEVRASVAGLSLDDEGFPEAVNSCVSRIVETVSSRAGNRPLVLAGEFVGFATHEHGELYKVGGGGGAPEAMGVPFDDDGLDIRLPLAGPMLSEGRMSLVFACTPGEATLGASVSAGGKTLGKAEVRLWPEGWGWLHVDLNTLSFGEMPVLDVRLTLVDGRAKDALDATRLWLGGLIVYPRSADHLWFSFLDDVSRHKVPVFSAVRAHGRRLALGISG